MKKISILGAILLVGLGIGIGCKESDSNDNDLLALFLLSRETCGQSPVREDGEDVGRRFVLSGCNDAALQAFGFERITQSGGLEGLFSNKAGAGWGEDEGGGAREVAMEVTYTLRNPSAYVLYAGNVVKGGGRLLNKENATNNFTHIRLEAGGIKAQTGSANTLDGSPASAAQSALFAAAPSQTKTFCLEFHREVEGGGDLISHLIAWDKPCSRLTEADRSGNYSWDEEYKIEDSGFTPSEYNSANGVGFLAKDAVVSRITIYDEPRATRGKIQ
jgi:hypothetical protein